jgi:hypothetical protein
MEDLFGKRPGVTSTRVGYTGGDVPNATYGNHDGHAEAIEIVFDPERTSYRELLEFFCPTTLNRQGMIAGLTALLVGIGALLGGMFLWVFVAIAVATNVIGYWFSDRLALKARRAQPVEPGTHPVLEATVQDLARRAQVPVPQLYLAERVAGV